VLSVLCPLSSVVLLLSSCFRHSLGQDAAIRLRYSRKAGVTFIAKSAVADLAFKVTDVGKTRDRLAKVPQNFQLLGSL